MEGIIASRNYGPGDEICIETVFAKVVQRKWKDVMCEYCCFTPNFLKACKECLAVKYCGRECQKGDWNSHKLECKHLKNLTKSNSADFMRLLGKIVLQIKGKNWKLITSRILGKEFSFDDIDSHYEEMTKSQRLILFFNETKESLGNYIGFENLPEDDSLVKIIGKVRFNVFRTRLLSFFIGASNFSLECIPNSNATLQSNAVKIWAFKKIKKETDKITLASKNVLMPATKFTDICFNCSTCADCSLPYGESILSKIIDKKKAYSVICETEEFLSASESFNDLLNLPVSENTADLLLLKQEGVLGETNRLRMGLLALRCLNTELSPFRRNRLLLKLVSSMRSVFGEYYAEMLPIYKSLCATYLQLGKPDTAMLYVEKMSTLQRYMI